MNIKNVRFSKSETIKYCFLYILMTAFIGIIFYDSLLVVFPAAFFIPVYLRLRKKVYVKEKSVELRSQFCEMITVISKGLGAGYSIENSFRESLIEMRKLYGEDAIITKELEEITEGLTISKTIEECLYEFSERNSVEDIKDFCEIFIRAKRNGGNFREIIASSVQLIKEKTEMEMEIQAMLKGKLLEQKIIMIIPFLLIGYLRITSGEFLSVIYHNPLGIFIMTGCLVLYLISYKMAEKITDIKV